MTDTSFELLTTSLPDREKVVIEVWHTSPDFGHRQVAELRFETEAEGPRVLLFPPEGGETWDFDLFELHRVVLDSWARFQQTFEPELSTMADPK